MTSDVLFYYTLYLIGPAIVDVLYLSFFSHQNTKVPTIISFVQLGINIILDYTLSKAYGLVGLALATTISQVAPIVIAFIIYNKSYGSLNIGYIFKNLIKILLAGAIIGAFANYFYKLRPSNLWLLVTIALTGLIYLLIVYLLKVDELDEIASAFKLKKKKS